MWCVCSGVSLQHSQSASPPDARDYNENLGLSVTHDHCLRHTHVTQAPEHYHERQTHSTQAAESGRDRCMQAPEPPPAYKGSSSLQCRGHLTLENRTAGQTVGDNVSQSVVDERRVTATETSVSAGVYNSDDKVPPSLVHAEYWVPTSPVVSTQFTSDVSLASSSVTSYEDNGRQKVW